MYRSLLFFHVLCGAAALISGFSAIVSRKGKKLHTRSGKIYVWAMYFTGGSALALSMMKFNPFLLALSLFAVYLTWSGNRALFYWRLRHPHIPASPDKVPVYISLLTSLFMIAYPFYTGFRGVPVLAVFGSIMLFNTIRDLQWLRKASYFTPGNKRWLIKHIGMMGGAYISTVTAFLVNNIHMQPSWLIWILPSLAGGVLITLAIRKWTKKLSINKVAAVVILILLSCASSLAQGSWIKGRIVNGRNEALPYVSIGIPGTSTGTVSDPEGNFSLFIPGTPGQPDTVRISYIGYETQLMTIAMMKAGSKLIILKEAPLPLDELTIKPSRLETKILGRTKGAAKMSTNFAITGEPAQNLGSAIGKKFRLGDTSYLQKLNVYFSYITFDTVVFRLLIYEAGMGKPGKNLLSQNIYFTVAKHPKGWITFDLRPYHLAYKGSVMIALEWVGHSVKGKYIGLPIVMPVPGATHYYRYGSQDNWKVFRGMSTSMNLEVETR